MTRNNISSCQIIPSYKHPITEEIEDSGGESSYATGQGMVESVLESSGTLEEKEDGTYNLTIHMSLMDLTRDHTFWVQKKEESTWESVFATITESGSDKNGTTSDFCFSIPDKESIIRISIYVEPMGREVIFYASLKNSKEEQAEENQVDKTQTEESETRDNGTEKDQIEENQLQDVQGLSLSTEEIDSSVENISENIENNSNKTIEESNNGRKETFFGTWFLILTLSITLSGLILLFTGAGIVYYFRKNWDRWGGNIRDDED